MNFTFTDEEKMVQDTVRNFAEKELKPIAIEIDKNHKIPDNIIKSLSELGFLGVYIPQEFGGAGLSFQSYVITVEEISKVCASTGVLISAHTSLCANSIYEFGTQEQKEKYLIPLASGEKIGCILLTEPEAGSDAANVSTTVKKEDNYYIANGNKIFVTNGGYRDYGILIATFDKSLRHKGISAFILDLKSEGIELLRNEDKMGIRGTFTSAFAFNNVKIPAENRLGEENDGFKIAMDCLDGGRIGIAAQALGIAEGAYERALAYAKERKQFGKTLSEFQAIQFKIADMAMRIEAAKLLVYESAYIKDNLKNGASYTDLIIKSSMAKAYASETATYVTKEALQIYGGYGYITEYEIERMYRDAKITEIYEGTNEVQRIVISKWLLK